MNCSKRIIISLIALLFTSFQAYAHSKWSYIDAHWLYGEVGEGECDEENFRLYATGRYQSNRCGKTTYGTASVKDMKGMRETMIRVMRNFHRSIMCTDEQVQDYTWNYKVKVPGFNKRKMYFQNHEGFTCYRGANPEIGEEMLLYEQLDFRMIEIASTKADRNNASLE